MTELRMLDESLPSTSPPSSSAAADPMSLAQVAPEAMDRDELVVEVRRLRLRLQALREQRDERLAQLRELEHRQLDDLAGQHPQVAAWQQRAQRAEAELAALRATRSMRLLRVPREVYGRVRAARAR